MTLTCFDLFHFCTLPSAATNRPPAPPAPPLPGSASVCGVPGPLSPTPPRLLQQKLGKEEENLHGPFGQAFDLDNSGRRRSWKLLRTQRGGGRHHLPPPGSPCALNSLNRPRSSRYMRLMVVAARALMPGMNSWSCRTAESRSTSEPSESLGSSEESFASESLADSKLLSSSSAGSNLGAGWGKLD